MSCATALGFGSFGAVEGIGFAAGDWEVGTPSFLLSYPLVLLTHRKAGWCWGRDTRNQPQAACTRPALLNADPKIHFSHLAAELICLSESIPTLMTFIRNFSLFKQAKGESTAIETRCPSHPWMDIILTLLFCSIKKESIRHIFEAQNFLHGGREGVLLVDAI